MGLCSEFIHRIEERAMDNINLMVQKRNIPKLIVDSMLINID